MLIGKAGDDSFVVGEGQVKRAVAVGVSQGTAHRNADERLTVFKAVDEGRCECIDLTIMGFPDIGKDRLEGGHVGAWSNLAMSPRFTYHLPGTTLDSMAG